MLADAALRACWPAARAMAISGVCVSGLARSASDLTVDPMPNSAQQREQSEQIDRLAACERTCGSFGLSLSVRGILQLLQPTYPLFSALLRGSVYRAYRYLCTLLLVCVSSAAALIK